MRLQNNIRVDLQKYSSYYKNSTYLGASILLKKFLDIDPDALIPASVSHGVDYYHCHYAQDIDSIEPIHWSCTGDIEQLKPTFFAPHPWAININLSNKAPNGKGTLLIGAAPSIENDKNLFQLLKKHSLQNFDILIKPKGNYLDSFKFWEKKGIRCFTAGAADNLFYHRLASIISEYENIICPELTSALFFSASIGKNIIIIPEFKRKVYENMNLLDEWDISSQKATNVVNTILSGKKNEIADLSQFLLGFDYLNNSARIRKDIFELLSQISRPFNEYQNNKIPYCIREFLALSLDKPRIMKMDYKDYFHLIAKGHVGILTICDFDLRSNGKDIKNFNLERIKFVPGTTEPGFGYPQYLN